jgi:hypothetical protein
MVDNKSVATAVADALNGIQRAMRFIPLPKATSTPEFDRWTHEMGEASRHVLMAFGIDPGQLKSPAIPCGGSWFVEWHGNEGESGEWRAVERP